MAEPKRMCLITRQMKPKSELLRLVKIDGKIVVDKKQKIQQRGFYVSLDAETLKNLKKSKALNRAFKMEIADSVYDEVMAACQKQS